METKHTIPPHGPAVQTLRLVFARLFWLGVGPIILFLICSSIVSAKSGWVTSLDGLYFAVLGLVVLARWYELKSGRGCDSYGNPATLAALPGYLRLVLPIAVGAWVVANVLGNHILAPAT